MFPRYIMAFPYPTWASFIQGLAIEIVMTLYIVYCIAGIIGGELNLAVWLSTSQPPN